MTDTFALETLLRRLEDARRRQVAWLASDATEGTPDLRQVDTLAALEIAVQCVRRQLEAA